MQNNAVVLLRQLLGTDEAVWRQLVVDSDELVGCQDGMSSGISSERPA